MSELVLITLPIGNNKDLTLRAKEKIESLDKIVAEDTRVFRTFCKHNDISLDGKKIESYHDHSGDKKIDRIMGWLEHQSVGLVSDAGSPIVSDPAYPLVVEAIKQQVSISSTPGVSAVTAALELSGLPPSPFHFYAFAPRDKGKKNKFFEEMSSVYGTHIFFEGVSRVKETVSNLVKILPDADLCLAREITKEYESIHRFKAQDWEAGTKDEVTYKGEFVVLVYNSSQVQSSGSKEIIDMANELIDKGIHTKKLSKLLSAITKRPTKEIYQKFQS